MKYVFLSLVIMIFACSVYSINSMDTFAQEVDIPPNAGTLGDEHEHASMLVKIFEENIDFSKSNYQSQSPWIHFEGGSNHLIHRHASNVTLGYLLDTLGITISDGCFTFSDGKKFCRDGKNSLRFYINHIKVTSITDYVIKQGDRILVSFGGGNKDILLDQLVDLDMQAFLADDLVYPKWLHNTFVWFAEDKISQDELFDAIQFLIDNKIISKIDSSQILIV